MDINCRKTNNGLLMEFDENEYSLKYPEYIWDSYPMKDILTDNLAYLTTINLPLVAGFKEINYNTSLPLFASQFFEMILRDIPGSVDDYDISAKEKIKEFMNIKYNFTDYKAKLPHYDRELEERAVIPLSNGKDSLCTLGVCREIGLDPVTVYINDTISPTENEFKIKNTNALTEEIGINHHIVENQIQKLSDFDHWNNDPIDIGYSHMITEFCFVALPFMHHYKAKYIVLGNQRNMNYPFKTKEGFLSFPSFDQKKEWTKNQDSMLKLMTNNQASVISVIEPLTNLGITKVLYSRYKKFTKYTMSCDCLDASKEERWCHACNKCARLFMMINAFGFDPKEAGFTKNLLNRRYKKLYALFQGDDVDHYEKSAEARDEQLLAFYLAYKNNVQGELMDVFKKKYLEEAKQREDELHKEFLSIHPALNLPNKIKDSVLSIYKEELP